MQSSTRDRATCSATRPDEQAVSTSLEAYARVHAFYQLCRFTSPPQPPLYIAFQLPFVVGAIVRPSKPTLIFSALTNILTILVHLPAVVDMDHWSLHTDIALLALLLAGKRGTMISNVIRQQLAVFYAAAGLWKVTHDHNDPQLSCSSLLLVQLLCGWLPERLLLPSGISLVANIAPHVTLVVELGVSLLLLGPGRAVRRLGVLLAIVLHIGIMLAPLPLSISDFGAMATSRLFWVFPEASARALAEVETMVLHGRIGSFRAVICAAAVPAASAVICAVHGSAERLVAHFAFCALLALLCRAAALDAQHDAADDDDGDAETAPSRSSHYARLLPPLLLGGSLFYAFGMPMLGLIDVGGCTMFSHIKLHGGNNHKLLPTGLLQRWLAESSPNDASLGLLADFAGGVIRIEHTTSAYLNGHYPGETLVLEPEPLARKTLRQAGHTARLFTHPGAREKNLRGKNLDVGGGLTTVGLGLVFKQLPNGAGNRPFIRYTLPALEMRMMLRGMRAANETFTLEFTRIRGSPPTDDHAAAEAWRREGCGQHVRLRERPRSLSCYVRETCEDEQGGSWLPTFLYSSTYVWRACAADELALLEAPGWFAPKLLLSNPYPILEPAGRYCGSSG